MATIARSTAGTITSILGTVSTTANVISDTVGVIGHAVNGASLKVSDWHYEQSLRSVHFRDELTEKLGQESMVRTLDLAKEVIKTSVALQDPELKQAYDGLIAARKARAEANAVKED